jgi:hypothetical protein
MRQLLENAMKENKAMDPVIDPQTDLVIEGVVPKDQQIRREFLLNVLTATPTDIEHDLQYLCKVWLKATNPGWIWLWLLYEGGDGQRPWELTAAVGRSGKPEDYVSKKPTLSHDQESVAEFCAHLKRPVHVTSIDKWQRELDGRNYRVIYAEELLSLECRSFVSVPLFFPKENQSASGGSPYSVFGNIRGLICAHFLEETTAGSLQSERAYLLMGHATAQAIAASFAAEQHRILFELDSLATQFLISHQGNLTAKRHDYLTRVINLIKEHLRVQYVSVFYRTRDKEQIECLASTGLGNADGELEQSKLAEARYEKNESIAGTVFATGNPFISQIGQTPKRPGGRTKYKWRETPVDTPEHELPWVAYPIKTPETDTTDTKSRTTLGVLRCVGNQSLLAKSIPRNYDPIQLQTLDFIARQLAPVLETMAIHIERERNVTVIKHDLYNPIRLIDTQTDAMENCIKASRPLPKYWHSNIKAALLLAKNLAGSLSEKQAFIPEPTFLEGDIVARLRDGLSYFARIENRMKIAFEQIRVIPRLLVDRDLIERALTNLLINAVKYGSKDTTITVLGDEKEENYLLHVRNYGMGVEKDEAMRIFEGEYRSPRVINLKQGLGLGLKIAKAAMRKHGGDLKLTSNTNPTEFTMEFPKTLAASITDR